MALHYTPGQTNTSWSTGRLPQSREREEVPGNKGCLSLHTYLVQLKKIYWSKRSVLLKWMLWPKLINLPLQCYTWGCSLYCALCHMHGALKDIERWIHAKCICPTVYMVQLMNSTHIYKTFRGCHSLLTYRVHFLRGCSELVHQELQCNVYIAT